MSEFSREDVRFELDGDSLAAWHYISGGDAIVVMAHGFCGTRDAGLEPFAEALAGAGLDVLLFDYRCFGDSTGEPRQLASFELQLADYRRAIEYARSLPGIDPQRVVLWGYSMSGGHVVRLGAEDTGAAAVVALAPALDGPAALAHQLRWVSLGGTGRLLAAAVRDRRAARTGGAPVLMPAVGPRGSDAALKSPDAEPGYGRLAAGSATWRNEFCARVAFEIPVARPGLVAGRVPCPLLIQIGGADLELPAAPARRAAKRAGANATLIEYGGIGHFGFGDEPRVLADQIAFVNRVVAREPEAVTA